MGDIQQDPSMEEILASIKRVIAEDPRAAGMAASAGRSRRAQPEEPVAETAAEEDVLELNQPVPEDPGLMSTDAAEASRDRLAALSTLRQAAEPPVDAGALEGVVRDMLRPMLKAWLDEHLPEIVERLVTREISRITGRHF
jgi:cell pole-organizing protein PopZ